MRPREREHARLAHGEGEVGAEGFAGSRQALSHEADAGAHAGNFLFPRGAELFVVEDLIDNGRTVRRGVGVFSTDDGLDD